LKDKERSGSRPPSVSKEIMVKIRKELEIVTPWDFRQVMDLIYKKEQE
jgi:hypothetical protein